MIKPSTTIAAGRDSWQRLRERERSTWADWLIVGRALIIGRTEALKIAKTNSPVGSRYNNAMGHWLCDNGLDGVVTPQERYRVILCIENLTMIEQWRAGLDEAQRRRLNHPGAIWARWQRSTRAEPQHRVVRGSPRRNGRPIFWPQHVLRRAAEALRDCRSNDIFTMTRAMLEAAIRDQADLCDLFPPEPLRNSRLQRAVPMSALGDIPWRFI